MRQKLLEYQAKMGTNLLGLGHGILQERILEWVAISLKQVFHFKILNPHRTFFKPLHLLV